MKLVNMSNGDIIDKITILEIKQDKITNLEKLNNVVEELSYLTKSIDVSIVRSLYDELKLINLKLWDIEDNLRLKESKKEFDDEFIQLARAVYFNNDKRASIKRQINLKTKSRLVEEKQYVSY